MKPLQKHLHPSIRRVFVDINTKELDDLKVAYKKQADDAEKQINDMQGKLDKMQTKLNASDQKIKLSESKNAALSEASTSGPTIQDQRPLKRQKRQVVDEFSFTELELILEDDSTPAGRNYNLAMGLNFKKPRPS